jgi:hypothetical protein
VSQVFKTRTFARWSRKVQVSDKALLKATAEMAAGLIDADLGGSVYKKRVPLPVERAVTEAELVEITDEEKSNLS